MQLTKSVTNKVKSVTDLTNSVTELTKCVTDKLKSVADLANSTTQLTKCVMIKVKSVTELTESTLDKVAGGTHLVLPVSPLIFPGTVVAKHGVSETKTVNYERRKVS